MQHDWQQVTDLFKALYRVVKPLDDDGIEVYFTSEPQTKQVNLHGESIMEKVKTRKLSQEDCNMERCLTERLKPLKHSRQKGTSIFILTNGVWKRKAVGLPTDSIDLCGVDDPIKNMARVLQSPNMYRCHVALQFIRFGDDELGRRRLRYLYDDRVKQCSLQYDIVDTRDCDDDVYTMLIGPLDTDNDARN